MFKTFITIKDKLPLILFTISSLASNRLMLAFLPLSEVILQVFCVISWAVPFALMPGSAKNNCKCLPAMVILHLEKSQKLRSGRLSEQVNVFMRQPLITWLSLPASTILLITPCKDTYEKRLPKHLQDLARETESLLQGEAAMAKCLFLSLSLLKPSLYNQITLHQISVL